MGWQGYGLLIRDLQPPRQPKPLGRDLWPPSAPDRLRQPACVAGLTARCDGPDKGAGRPDPSGRP